MRIRLAGVADAAAISALVIEAARRFVFPDQSPAAIEHLLAWMGAQAIGERIASGHRHHVAEIDQAVVGVVGTRDDCHVHLLFVDERFQRRAIARQLWNAALAACCASTRPPARITVASSAHAVPVYRRLGFVDDGAPVCKDDVVAIPMVFSVSNGPMPR
ncbi:MAG TPA: GNAT family N-acetyltransferase [Dokdonella sp.]